MSRFDQNDSTFAAKLTGLEASIERVNQRIGKEHHEACPMGVRMLAARRPNCLHGMQLCTECQPCDCGHSFRPFIVGDAVRMRKSPDYDGQITEILTFQPTTPTFQPTPRYYVDWGTGGNQYEREQLQRAI